MPPIPPALQDPKFTLDASGISGFFGGEEAISAMATVHVYANRRWLGWYNLPGSYTVAKQYGRLAKARWLQGLFPGGCDSPAKLFEFDGDSGPEYMSISSGTRIQDTGHIGNLFMEECDDIPVAMKVEGRTTTPSSVTIVKLEVVPPERSDPTLHQLRYVLLASIPILSSLCASTLCAIYGDWPCFSMILLGIVSNGVSCLVIGSADLTFTHPIPSADCPPADGILKGGKNTVILFGEEGAVNSITRGKFSLEFNHDPQYMMTGLCCLLLYLQLLAQLLVVPQGELFGQIMFLASFVVSWAYNSYLSSLDKKEIQRKMLSEVLKVPKALKYELPNRTSMVVFVLLILEPSDPQKVLESLLPNDTNTWRIWKRAVLGKLKDGTQLEFDASDHVGVEEGEKKLLQNLFGDAEAAYKGYLVYEQNRK